MRELIVKYVLQNILKFGTAKPQSVMGKMLGEQPELKKENKEVLLKDIATVIDEVTSWSKEKQEQEFSVYAGSIPEKKIVTTPPKQFKELPELPEVDKEYTFRIEVGPSGMLHIGHLIVTLLNSEYAKKYNGKFILRISDTNPDNIDPEAYKGIVHDAEWITTNNVAEVIVQSEKMDIYYMYAKELIDMEKAYVCTCDPELFREFVNKKEACPCRDTDVERNLTEWDKMFTEYQQGEAVLRVKTAVDHKNPAVRDWPAFRINDSEHPKTGKKYRVWPLMNFAVAIDDHESGMTHIIRGKDHIVNKERQEYIYKHFGWWTPHFVHIGKLNFTNMKMKTSLTKQEIAEGKYDGWDDVRLPFIAAFKRRGITPAAFIKYIHELGPSKVDKTVDYNDFMKAIYSYNKEFIDEHTPRYFFVQDPKTITINDAPDLTIEAPLHPEHTDHGVRNFVTGKQFYVADALEKGKLYRFMHLFNFKDDMFQGEAYDSTLKATLIHWLPVQDGLLTVRITMPDGTTVKGLGEPTLKNVNAHDIIQFERVGFCRLDKKEDNKMIFCYGHR